MLKSAAVDFGFFLSLCLEITLELCTLWSSGRAECCKTRVVPVSKRLLLFFLTLLMASFFFFFFKVTFQSAQLVIAVNVLPNSSEYIAN